MNCDSKLEEFGLIINSTVWSKLKKKKGRVLNKQKIRSLERGQESKKARFWMDHSQIQTFIKTLGCEVKVMMENDQNMRKESRKCVKVQDI